MIDDRHTVIVFGTALPRDWPLPSSAAVDILGRFSVRNPFTVQKRMDEAGGVLVVRVCSALVDSRVFGRDEGGLATMIAVWTEKDLPGR